MRYLPWQIYAVGVACLVLPLGAVCLRIWAKLLGRRGLWWDDYMIFLAMVIQETRN